VAFWIIWPQSRKSLKNPFNQHGRPDALGWRRKWYDIIFLAETPAGKRFDLLLLWLITLSVVTVMLESVESVRVQFGHWFLIIEWVLTILFTLEYVMRIITVRNPMGYMFSFFGVVDFLAILPTYFTLAFAGTGAFQIIRILRLLRIFRVLKMVGFLREAALIRISLIQSRRKVTLFFLTILTIAVLMGTVMYVIETGTKGFESIPQSVYWAVVTLTTVGFGDIVPQTALGQFMTAILVVLGYSIIVVPTGIVSAEFIRAEIKEEIRTHHEVECSGCGKQVHAIEAKFCADCGTALHYRPDEI